MLYQLNYSHHRCCTAAGLILDHGCHSGQKRTVNSINSVRGAGSCQTIGVAAVAAAAAASTASASGPGAGTNAARR